eukprot:723545-Amphidinium_carterae.2
MRIAFTLNLLTCSPKARTTLVLLPSLSVGVSSASTAPTPLALVSNSSYETFRFTAHASHRAWKHNTPDLFTTIDTR